ncbi:MAG: D-2-hydroxyacid dehydrogenase [Clostridia bacterium]|nr:D-2-hydroxyacid dehydrogenase [Clostridia bacterium]
MQLVVLDGYPINPGDLSWDGIRNFGTLSVYDRTDPLMAAQRMRGADIVLTNKCRVGREELQASRNLRLVAVLATGYDVVDIKAAKELGITVCNVPSYSTEAVAQLTFAHILEHFSRVGQHSALVHKGAWAASPDFTFWQIAPRELNGLTLGILGCGQIGGRVAEMGRAFGMKIIGFSPSRRAGFAGDYVDLDALLKNSDVLTLHCPAKEDTVGIINAENIAKMKDGALLINTARGSLVVERDIRDALESGKLSGYGTDVASKEPISVHNPLIGANNCTVTPHYGWAPKSARIRLLDVTARNIQAFLNGQPQNVVNP